MFENIKKYEVMVADKVFHFLCDAEAPPALILLHVKEAMLKIANVNNESENIAKEVEKPLQEIEKE